MITVAKEMDVKPVAGDIGVEIEVEGHNLPRLAKYWRNDKDGSLKGESMEYVLAKPLTLDGVKVALDYLNTKYIEAGSDVHDSVRAGVHIHINCQQLSMTELFNFITVYLILENLLVKWCGKYREGNLFCLRAIDADYIVNVISDTCSRYKAGRGNYRAAFRQDDLRYSSMNVKALGDYGSLEFRAMRGTRDLGLIYSWAETLLGLREYAKQFQDPSHIPHKFSQVGALGFAKEALGKNFKLFDCADAEVMLWEGLHNAQDVAYATDWSKLEPKMRKVGQLDFPEDIVPDEPDEDF